MNIALASTFNPRGEIGRLQRYYSQMQSLYQYIIMVMPPTAKPEDVDMVKALPDAQVSTSGEWSSGRFRSLQYAYETGADFIQYADLDRLIRWIETRPDELKTTVDRIQTCDCLVLGRTPAAWATHPQVMIQMEQVINSVFSQHLGMELDFGAGSKGFSRRAAELIVANARPLDAIGSDTEWPILCHRAGLTVEGLLVDGLDWEIPDQYQDRAADRQRQRQVAEAYDADVKHWQHRMKTTQLAVAGGLAALERELIL
ncbi:MAG: hypothetical protein K8L97_00415 [Anaerolineae bacterium]|nr:hypothetical protein [Anaerolineae bacterium]